MIIGVGYVDVGSIGVGYVGRYLEFLSSGSSTDSISSSSL